MFFFFFFLNFCLFIQLLSNFLISSHFCKSLVNHYFEVFKSFRTESINAFVHNFMIGLEINNEFVFPRCASENIVDHYFLVGERWG